MFQASLLKWASYLTIILTRGTSLESASKPMCYCQKHVVLICCDSQVQVMMMQPSPESIESQGWYWEGQNCLILINATKFTMRDYQLPEFLLTTCHLNFLVAVVSGQKASPSSRLNHLLPQFSSGRGCVGLWFGFHFSLIYTPHKNSIRFMPAQCQPLGVQTHNL